MHLCRFAGKLTFSVKATRGILFTAMRHIQTMSISGVSIKFTFVFAVIFCHVKSYVSIKRTILCVCFFF